MKLVRVEYKNSVSFGELREGSVHLMDGSIFDEWRYNNQIVPLDDVQLLAPVLPPQIIALGLNYHGHAKECNLTPPKEPLIFLKGINAVTGPNCPIILPEMAPDEVDIEAELVIVIGKVAKNVPESKVYDYILGYTCGNDVSARDCQLKKDSQWTRGKSFDTFAPIGPVINTEIDPDNLEISSRINDAVIQQSNTSDMIFGCREIVSFVSKCMTLYPGSIIMTGTPSGVGLCRKPPVYLKAGDTSSVEIEGIGMLVNGVCGTSSMYNNVQDNYD